MMLMKKFRNLKNLLVSQKVSETMLLQVKMLAFVLKESMKTMPGKQVGREESDSSEDLPHCLTEDYLPCSPYNLIDRRLTSSLTVVF